MPEPELRRLIPCTCDEAYTSRGLTAPDCPWHNYGEDVQDLFDQRDQRIAELEAENDQLWHRWHQVEEYWAAKESPDE